jgi:predicted PurR-regulated permease PerM
MTTMNSPGTPRPASGKDDAHAVRPEPRLGPRGRRGSELLLAQVTRVIIILSAVLLLFYCASSVVLPVLLAWVGSMALYPPMNWLRARRIPAPLATVLILGILITGLGFGLIHLGRPISDWVRSAPDSLPRLREKYQRLFGPVSRFMAAVQNTGGKSTGQNAPPPTSPLPSADGAIAGTVFTWTGSLLTGAAETGVLLFLLLATGDHFTPKLAGVLRNQNHEKKETVEVSRQIQQNISKYLFSVSVINALLGIGVGLTLGLAGMPNAAMWGVIAAVVNYVPYFGPFVGIFVVAIAGLLAFDTVTRGLLPAGIYLLWHLLEADLVTPFFLGRRFKLNPVVIFVALMFCAWLWGIVGALLAMPLLVTLQVICSRVPALAALGELLAA